MELVEFNRESFDLDPVSGLIVGIPFYSSPHYNHRPFETEINLLVIHDTEIVASDEQDYQASLVHYLFTAQYEKLKDEYRTDYHQLFPTGEIGDVSAHLVLRRTGDVIQYVPFNHRAWHAGVSEFEGCENCNDFSIGIELEGYANRKDFPYTDIQYHELAKLTVAILNTYPKITLERIVGHEDIARPLHRKSDPGLTFDWGYYRQLIEDYR